MLGARTPEFERQEDQVFEVILQSGFYDTLSPSLPHVESHFYLKT